MSQRWSLNSKVTLFLNFSFRLLLLCKHFTKWFTTLEFMTDSCIWFKCQLLCSRMSFHSFHSCLLHFLAFAKFSRWCKQASMTQKMNLVKSRAQCFKWCSKHIKLLKVRKLLQFLAHLSQTDFLMMHLQKWLCFLLSLLFGWPATVSLLSLEPPSWLKFIKDTRNTCLWWECMDTEPRQN